MEGTSRSAMGPESPAEAAQAASRPRDRAALEQVLVKNLALIDRVVAFVVRRHGLASAEADDLASVVRLKLVEDDYRILGQFEGRSSFATYLTTVIQRIFLDDRIHRWGKWRPSAEAKRLGPVAVRLESLMSRDGLSREEAFCALETADRGLARDKLLELAVRLPPRTPRREVAVDAAEEVVSASEGAEAGIFDREARETATEAEKELGIALATLSCEDRLVIKMRFFDSFTVTEIAAALHIEPKPLYRRIETILAGLRRRLEASGLGADAIERLSAGRGWDIRVDFGTVRETGGSGPSKKEM